MHNRIKELQYRRDVLSDYLRSLLAEKEQVEAKLKEVQKELYKESEHHGVLSK